MNSSYDNNIRTGCGCGGNAWQNQDQGCQNYGTNMMGNDYNTMMTNNGCGCQPTPIVMPTRVMARQAFSFVEQPVIIPVECRTINRTVLVPRFYPTYTQTVVNCPN